MSGMTGTTGNDTFKIVGDFSTTSLRLNTITIDGDAGDDTVDITSLDSTHRIVFRSNGGRDTIVGTMRPQDVIELPNGATAADYTTTTVNGVTTMTKVITASPSLRPDGMPQLGPPLAPATTDTETTTDYGHAGTETDTSTDVESSGAARARQ